MRNTKARELVITNLIKNPTPLTIEELFEKTRKKFPKTAFSTVFRIVKALEESKKINRIDWSEKKKRFEWADKTHHHHIICEDCRKVEDLSDEVLRYNNSQVSKKTGFLIKRHSIELFGLCNTCQKREIKA